MGIGLLGKMAFRCAFGVLLTFLLTLTVVASANAALPVRLQFFHNSAAAVSADGKWVAVAGIASIGDWSGRREQRVDLYEVVGTGGSAQIVWRASSGRIGGMRNHEGPFWFSESGMYKAPTIEVSPDGQSIAVLASKKLLWFHRNASVLNYKTYTESSFAGVEFPTIRYAENLDSDPMWFDESGGHLYLLRPSVVAFNTSATALTVAQLQPAGGFGQAANPLLGPLVPNSNSFYAHGGSWHRDSLTGLLEGSMDATPTSNPLLEAGVMPPILVDDAVAWLDEVGSGTLRAGIFNQAWQPPTYDENLNEVITPGVTDIHTFDMSQLSSATSQCGVYSNQFLRLVSIVSADSFLVSNDCTSPQPPGDSSNRFMVIDREPDGSLVQRFADPPSSNGPSSVAGFDWLIGYGEDPNRALGYGDKGIARIAIGESALSIEAKVANRVGVPRLRTKKLGKGPYAQRLAIRVPAWATSAVVYAGCGSLAKRYRVVPVGSSHKTVIRWVIPRRVQGCDFSHMRAICVVARRAGEAVDLENNQTCAMITMLGKRAGQREWM